MIWFTKSAKTPSPVQIRAAPPIISSVNTVTYRLSAIEPWRQLRAISGQNGEQPLFDVLDRLAVRGIDHVCVDVEGRRNAGVPKLFLGDLHRHLQVVEQGRMNVAEFMLRHASQPSSLGCWLQHIPQQFRLPQRVASAITEHEILRRLPSCALPVISERFHGMTAKRKPAYCLLCLRPLELALEHCLAHGEVVRFEIEHRPYLRLRFPSRAI